MLLSNIKTAFITEHGYEGDAADVEARVAFLRAAFASAGMDAPREIREWFTPGQPIMRDTAFLICFAFGLGGGETDEFFGCQALGRVSGYLSAG